MGMWRLFPYQKNTVCVPIFFKTLEMRINPPEVWIVFDYYPSMATSWCVWGFGDFTSNYHTLLIKVIEACNFYHHNLSFYMTNIFTKTLYSIDSNYDVDDWQACFNSTFIIVLATFLGQVSGTRRVWKMAWDKKVFYGEHHASIIRYTW